MNLRKFALEILKNKLPLECIIIVTRYLSKRPCKIDTKRSVKYRSGYRKDKLRYHIHYH
jgi:hypothetical protein